MQPPADSAPSPRYHVSRFGQPLGEMPIEELRRRRAAGEFSGVEQVWREGMAAWREIDTVLGPPPLPRRPTPQARPSRGSGWWIGVGVSAGILVLGLSVAAGWWGFRQLKRVTDAAALQARHDITPDGMDLVGPIAVPAGSTHRLSRLPAAREFRERHYLEGYRRDGVRLAANDEAVLRYLELWLTASFDHPTVEEEQRLIALGDQLVADQDLRDPIVLSILATNGGAPDRDARCRLLSRAASMREESRHRPYPWFCTIVSLAATYRNDASEVAELDALALRLLEQAIRDGSLPPGDQEVLAENFVSGWAEGFFNRQGAPVLELLNAAGPDWQWLRLLLEGDHHINLAWKARGGGYANTVNESGWRGFAEELDLAIPPLEQAWKLHPERPSPAARMITVAMGQSRPEAMRLWLDRAIAAESDYRMAWSNFRWALRPRWFGSEEALLALGDAALATARFDTDVPRQFWIIVDDIAADRKLADGETLYSRADIWPRLQRMFEGYVSADLPEPLRARWRTDYAVAAYSAGKYDVARTQLKALNWDPMPSRLNVRGRPVKDLVEAIEARTGPRSARGREPLPER